MTKRLLTIANLVQKNSRVADIGTDHGFVPKYLIDQNIASFVLACDINLGPLERAKNFIGLNSNIEIRQSDGLANIKKEDNIDTIIISGMGGHLITNILAKNFHTTQSIKQLILSPHNAQNSVRKFLHNSNFKIINEIFLKDMSKFYVIIIAEKGSESYNNEYEYEYGRFNIKKLNLAFQEFVNHRKIILTGILNNLDPSSTRYAIVNKELEDLKCIL